MVLKASVKITQDYRKIRRKIDAGHRRALYGIGGLMRKGIRQNLRKKKNASKPGRPPRVIKDPGGLREVRFAVDLTKRNVVAGSIRFPTRYVVPGIMEHGGRSAIRKRAIPRKRTGKKRHLNAAQLAAIRRQDKVTPTILVPISIRPRPYAKPAHEKLAKRKAYIRQYARLWQ